MAKRSAVMIAQNTVKTALLARIRSALSAVLAWTGASNWVNASTYSNALQKMALAAVSAARVLQSSTHRGNAAPARLSSALAALHAPILTA